MFIKFITYRIIKYFFYSIRAKHFIKKFYSTCIKERRGFVIEMFKIKLFFCGILYFCEVVGY